MTTEPVRSSGESRVEADTETEAEVVVGEVPSSHDFAHMLWTARCSERDHDLLGHFETREEAEQMRTQHLEAQHKG